jgi:hypothetical protein
MRYALCALIWPIEDPSNMGTTLFRPNLTSRFQDLSSIHLTGGHPETMLSFVILRSPAVGGTTKNFIA